MTKMTTHVAVMIVFLLCASCQCIRAEEELPKILKTIQPAVAVITTYDAAGKPSTQGSGFFIDGKGRLVTNLHVLVGATKAEVKTADGTIFPLQSVIAEDKDSDLLVIEVATSGKTISALPLTTQAPEVGSKVIVVGNPLGLAQSVSDGIVAAIREMPPYGTVYQITAPVSPGSSGSPVINLKGEVIGIATLQMTMGQNLNFAVPSAKIAELKPFQPLTLAEWTTRCYQAWYATPEGMCYAGKVYMGRREYNNALTFFLKAVKTDAKNCDGWILLGGCYYELKRYPDANRAFLEAIKLRPKDSDAHRLLGMTYLRMDQQYNAFQEMKKAIDLGPDNPFAYFTYGLACSECQLWQEAEVAFHSGLVLKPDDAMAHYQLGVIYIVSRDLKAAMAEYTILRKLDGKLAQTLMDFINNR